VRLLGFEAELCGPPDIVGQVARLFALPEAVASRYAPPTRARIEAHVDERGVRIVRDGSPFWHSREPSHLVPTLEWTIADTAIKRVGSRVPLLHAGAVALHGRALVIPGQSGAGKSTLVAALVASGFAYLADDVTVIEPGGTRLLPFGRAIGLKHGSVSPLVAYYPDLEHRPAGQRFGSTPLWYIVPPAPAWSTEPVPLGAVVLPRFEAGGATTLDPVTRGEAVSDVLPQLFEGRAIAAAGVGQIVALLRQAVCYRLTFGDLPSAVTALRAVLSD
jgi:hypothetical protein